GAPSWDLYINGKLKAADLGQWDDQVTGFQTFKLTGHSHHPLFFDDLALAGENPLFTDADRDGMPDDWELAHGLNPTIDDRSVDSDEDGRTAVEEWMQGSDPRFDDRTPVDLDEIDISTASEAELESLLRLPMTYAETRNSTIEEKRVLASVIR